jgi:hypothetical protein
VLPVPSRTGPDGPPPPFGAQPRPGPRPAHTPRTLPRRQDHALLDGPFPHRGLGRGVSDGALVLSGDSRVRVLTMMRIHETGANVVRIPVDWRHTVLAEPPSGFDARNPGDPSYRFARIDAGVRDARAAGLEPLLVVSHAPAFAEASPRWPYAYPGSWAPSPNALEEFAVAVSRRFDGSFPDPLVPGTTLPRVSLFQAWNEPNLARYLEPQWVAESGRWRAFAPVAYRQMLNAFYAGVKSVEGGDVVVAAGLAPNGDPEGVGRTAPLSFLREMLCLPPAGVRAGTRCADPPHFDALAFHPLSVGDPDQPAGSSLDVSISDAGKIARLLSQAETLRTAMPASAKPLWVTELNWEGSSAASGAGVPAALQPAWVSRALHRLWIAGVSLVQWEFLVDPYPGVLASTPTGGFIEYQRPAGLYSAGPGGNFEGARPKAFLRGFTFPFDPLRTDHRNVRVWALLMHSREPALLQRQLHDRRWRTVASLRADRYGVLNSLVLLHGAARLRLKEGLNVTASATVSDRRTF